MANAISARQEWCWLDDWDGRSVLGIATEVRRALPGRERDFLSEMRAALTSAHSEAHWIVAFGYEFGTALLGEPRRDSHESLATETAVALRLETALVLDHATKRAELHAEDDAMIDSWIHTFGQSLYAATPGVGPALDPPGEPPLTPPYTTTNAPARWRSDAPAYQQQVEACREAIREGDAYVLCLTDTAELVVPRLDPLVLFETVRGARRGGIIVMGEHALVSASPERFLSLSGSALSTHPIKGTRPRSADANVDRSAANELALNAKERAENLMIVDLMRNDFSRVCLPGSVATSEFLRVESHQHVHQLVSTVSGELRPECDVFDAIVAAFPGGSMTGAPKQRAIQILHELESGQRGWYSGCFGWIQRDHTGATSAELAMTIRSVTVAPERGAEGAHGVSVSIGAGGGITIDSDPAAEQAEKLLKAAPLLDAVAHAARYS